MAYEKERYVSNLRSLNYWSDDLKTQNSLSYTNVLKTAQDMSWQTQLKTINDFNWQNLLKTPQNSIAFTGVAYKWTPDSASKNPANNIIIYDGYNDKQINSIFDAAAMSNNDKIQHSNIVTKFFDNVFDNMSQWWMDDEEKKFYQQYKAATGKNGLDMLGQTRSGFGNTSYQNAYLAYQKMKGINSGAFNTLKYDGTSTSLSNVLGKSNTILDYYKEHPELGYTVPDNAKTLDEVLDKYGEAALNGSDVTLIKDKDGNINIIPKKTGFGSRYSDGTYEYDNLGEAIVGTEITNKANTVGNSLINFVNDSINVLWNQSWGPLLNPDIPTNLKAPVMINNTLVNLSETLDVLFFYKPVIQTIADQYDDYIQQGNKRDIESFFKILWTKDQSLIYERRRNLARYYGLDINDFGDISGPYEEGRHQMNYNNVLDKFFGLDFEVNLLGDVGKTLETAGVLLNEIVNIPNSISGTQRNEFGLDWGKFNFEINIGDLVMEMLDPVTLANILVKTTNAAKGSQFIKANSKDLAKEIIDNYYSGIDYKTLPYADRLQLYDYIEAYLRKHADDFGKAYANDFERTIRAQQKAGNFFQGVDIKTSNATDRELSNLFFKLNTDMGGTINTKLTSAQYKDLINSISNSITRNNANTIITSLTGGMSDFAYLNSAGVLKATLLPIELPATTLGKGLKNLGNKLGIPDRFNKVVDSLSNTVATQFRKELEKSKLEYNKLMVRYQSPFNNQQIDQLGALLNRKVTLQNNKQISKKLEQIIKENLISYDLIKKGFIELGANPDQIISVQTRILTTEVVPEILDILKSTDNPTQMLSKMLPVLNQFSSKNITDLTDFIQVLKDMQTSLVKEYNFTNYGSAALTSRLNSKWAFTGMENLIKWFEDLDQLMDALMIKDSANFIDIDPAKLRWADNVIATSDWALEAGITGSTQKQTRFMWALSEAQNEVNTGLKYEIDLSVKSYTEVVKDLLGYRNYNVGKLGTYTYQIRDALKDIPEQIKNSLGLQTRVDSLSYYAKQIIEEPYPKLTGAVVKYAIIEPTNYDLRNVYKMSRSEFNKLYIEPVRKQLTDIDEKGYFKANANNDKIAKLYPKVIKEVVYTAEDALINIADIQKLLINIQQLNLDIEKPNYTKIINAKKLSSEVLKAIGIEAQVQHFSDKQLNELWKIVEPLIPIGIKEQTGQYFLNSNKATQEFDPSMQIGTYTQEKIVKAFLSMVADNTNSPEALDYLKNITKATLSKNGSLTIHYDYISDIQQGLSEISEYINKYIYNTYDILDAKNIRYTKLEEYSNKRFLYDSNKGIKMFEEHPLAYNLIMNIFNIDEPMFTKLYEGLGITKGTPLYGILTELYFILQGKQDMLDLERMIRTSKYLDTDEQKALLTALYYTDTDDYYDIALNPHATTSGTSLDAWKQETKRNMTDYLGLTNIDYEKDNLANILAKYKISFDIKDLEEVDKKSNKLVELIDTIKSKETNYNKDNIIALTLNNTQKYGGYPFEFGISVLGEDNKGHTLSTSKINYHSFTNALDALPLSTQLADKYFARDTGTLWNKFFKDYKKEDQPEKPIETVLMELYEVLTSLSMGAEKAGVEKLKIYTFGDTQNVINLFSAINRLGLPAEPNAILDHLEFIDFLNEEYRPSQNSSFKTLSTEASKEVDNILNYYFNKAKEKQKIANNVHRRIKMSEDINTETLQRLTQYLESPMAQAALIYSDTTEGKLAINALSGIEHFFDINTDTVNDVTALIFHGLNQMLEDFANSTRNIDQTNTYFKKHFTDKNLLSEPEFLRMVSENTNIPFNKVLNSTTQVYNAVADATLTFGEKNFKTSLLNVLDTKKLATDFPNKNSVVAIVEIAEAINNEANRIKNARPLMQINKNIKDIITDMKEYDPDAFVYLSDELDNPKESWGTLIQIKNTLEYRLAVTPQESVEYKYYQKVYEYFTDLINKESNAELKRLLVDSTELYEPLINWDGTTNLDKFKYNAYIDMPYQLKVQKAIEDLTNSEQAVNDMIKHLDISREMNFAKAIEDSFEYVKTPLTELHNYLIKIQKSEPKDIKRIMDTSRTLKDFLDNRAATKRLQLSDELLIKYLIANTPDKFFLVNIPESIQDGIETEYAEAFVKFMERKESLKEIGINVTEHPEEGLLEVSLDYDMYHNLIKRNKDYNTKNSIKYQFNGEKVLPIVFDDLTEQELNTIYTITQDQETIDTLLRLKRNFEEIEPTLVGNVGNLHSELLWENFKNTELAQSLNAIKWINNRPKWDKGTLYNEWNLGTSQTINKIQPTSPNMINTLVGLGNRISKSHEDYAEVLDMFLNNTSGFSFKGNMLKQLSNEEINQMLTDNPDMKVVLPIQDKLFNMRKANGGISIRTIDKINDINRKQLEQGGGMIIPSDVYRFVLHHVNNFNYGNPLTSMFAKIIGGWKVSQIVWTGTQMRNAIDTPFKTLGAVKDPKMFITNEVWAVANIQNYKQIMMDIKQAYGHIDDRLIDLYFDGRIKGTPIMNRQAFNILDSYYRIVGETIDDDVSFIQKILIPTSWTEEVNRISLYKSYIDQGYTTSEAADAFANLIHFDYTTKSRTEAYAKFVFPYWTYFTNQIRWFLQCFSEQPELARFFVKSYENHWEQDDRFNNENAFGYKESSPNYTLLYAKYNGLLLDQDSNLTFKGNPSLWDSLNLFANPEQEVASKLAVPLQIIYNTIMEAVADSTLKDANLSVIQQYIKNTYATYDTRIKQSNTGIAWIDSLYSWMQINKGTKAGGGTYSVQNMLRGKYNLMSTLAQLVPFLGSALTRFESGVKNFERSGKWEDIILPSVYGAIQDRVTYEHKDYYYPTKTYIRSPRYPRRAYSKVRTRKSYAKKSYAKKAKAMNPKPLQTIYYRPGKYGNVNVYYGATDFRTYNTPNKYSRLMSKAMYPNRSYNIGNNYNPKLQSIPQYLHSYNGLTRQGKSKLLNWMHMSTRWKVKTALRRQARARSLYSRI